MNGNGSVWISGEVIIDNLHEIVDDIIWWSGPIDEEKVVVLYVIFSKSIFIVKFVIESNDSSNSVILEYFDVFLWFVTISLLLIPFLDWSHKGSKLVRNDPVHVSIFDTLVEFVLFNVESFELVPSEF